MLAYDYPLLGVFWSLFIFSMFVLWIFVVVWCFVDNFRRHDHHGMAKAMWFLALVFIPMHRRVRVPRLPPGRGRSRASSRSCRWRLSRQRPASRDRT